MKEIIQFKKGVLGLCVMVLINQRDRYGFELAQQISKHVEVAEGALYPVLRRMVADGHCTTYLQESTEGPPRKYYTLTPEGKAYMNELVTEWQSFVSGVTTLLEKSGSENEQERSEESSGIG
ncbi:PadR family transcriptional regulator [Paenibacillus sp. ACRRX]|uniref:PadR family transcriptional regulator n=1 Tax=Paenibacillus sp. ACRRX TaxID=2918206 RepID=UPI001EF72D8B|nr:PadR family transcriptional regulator [Paenibacillus sp. ACRRX]MCG7408803.1 PadR family transcriptional regulator [Paenibacillus sp. ACRRX]